MKEHLKKNTSNIHIRSVLNTVVFMCPFCPADQNSALWAKKAGQAVKNQDCTKSGIKNSVEAICD